MTLQNRVDPFGDIVATSARGMVMGNRGRLHDENRDLMTRRWTTKAWICCLLKFGGRQRRVMAPDRYTELFFLDEATAFAAGHRPCYECRRRDYRAFMDAWARGHGLKRPPRAGDVDAVLHAERLGNHGSRSLTDVRLGSLPDGAMVLLPGDDANPWLVWRGKLHPWSFEGYGGGIGLPRTTVRVLTPPSIVRVLGAGYLPMVHPSVNG